jgi:hypothetical protein
MDSLGGPGNMTGPTKDQWRCAESPFIFPGGSFSYFLPPRNSCQARAANAQNKNKQKRADIGLGEFRRMTMVLGSKLGIGLGLFFANLMKLFSSFFCFQ